MKPRKNGETWSRFPHAEIKSELVIYTQTELVIANGFCTVFIANIRILVDASRTAIARVDAGESTQRTHTHDFPGIVTG